MGGFTEENYIILRVGGRAIERRIYWNMVKRENASNIYAQTHTHTYIYIYIIIYESLCLCMCVYVRVCMCVGSFMCTRVCVRACKWDFTHVYVYVLACVESFESNTKLTLSYLPNPSARARYDTRPIFKRSLAGLNSELSFSETSCLPKAEEPSLLYYLPIARGRIFGFVPLPRVLVLCEMQSVSSRI